MHEMAKSNNQNWRRRADCSDIYILSINKPIFNFHGDDWRTPGLECGNASRFTYSRLTHARLRPMVVGLPHVNTHIDPISPPTLTRDKDKTRWIFKLSAGIAAESMDAKWNEKKNMLKWSEIGVRGRQKRWKCRKSSVGEFRPFITC